MDAKSPVTFEHAAPAIDLRLQPVEQAGRLLDLVQFDCFLDYVYAVLLKRAPDREGRVHYQAIEHKGASRAAIVRRLLHSREARLLSFDTPGMGTDDFINRVYQDILGRWPDEEGLVTYRWIVSKRGGRKRVIANLLASDEALCKGGGRLARVESLRSYAARGWPTRLPLLGSWFAGWRRHRRRLDLLAVNQSLLAQQIADLKRDLDDADLARGEPFGFAPTARSDDAAGMVFQNALIRARRER